MNIHDRLWQYYWVHMDHKYPETRYTKSYSPIFKVFTAILLLIAFGMVGVAVFSVLLEEFTGIQLF